MSLAGEFKKFAMRGNVIDMAVGVIIGGAFGKIVSSLVNDIIMPPLGLITGGVDFTDMRRLLSPAVMEGDKIIKPAVYLNYGMFINTVFDFVIMALAIFFMIKAINTAKEHFEQEKDIKAAAPPVPPADVVILTEIRDLLKENQK